MLTERRERGQVLILFIALFSVLLTMAAIGIDQGLWLGQRGIAQKDADAAARAGAAVYLSAMDAPSSADAAAQARAVQYAVANGAPTPIPTVTSNSGCPTIGGSGASSPTPIPNAPSVSIGVGRPAPGLFTRALWGLLGMAGSPDQSGIGASSTACVGSVLTIGPDNSGGKPLNLPVEIFSTATTCFDATGKASVGTPRIGMQCVIKNSDPRHGYLHKAASASQCTGATDPIQGAIESGEDWTCTVSPSPGGACTDTTCASPADTDVANAIMSWNKRLSGSTTCKSDSFADTFDYADGRSGPVLGPPGLNDPPNSTRGADPAGTVYVQKRCSNPRVGIVIVSDGDGKPVRGFAAVYIVGCFTQTNTANNLSSSDVDEQRQCDEVNGGTKVEIRAVLLRLYMTDGAVGGIGPINDGSISGALSPVTIQTTR